MDGSNLIDPRELRNALGRFATGVCVVTTCDENGLAWGLTINSFCSVSLTPPLVAWWLGSSAPSMAAFVSAEYFAVNVLHVEQRHVAQHFARPSEDKFSLVSESLIGGLGDVPVMADALASFECRKSATSTCGDHVMFLGQVERFRYGSSAPLLFHAGRFLDHPPSMPSQIPVQIQVVKS